MSKHVNLQYKNECFCVVLKSNSLTLNLWFSGSLHHVVWWLDINVSEDCAASIFRILQNVGIQLSHYTAQQSQKPQILSSLL